MSNARANASTLFFSTTNPVVPSITVSGTVPERVVTTGNPAAMASTGGRPKPSFHIGAKAKISDS